MTMLYTLLKFLHIVGAIGWIGGVVTFSIISAQVAREKDQAVLTAMTRLMGLNGMVVIGPASGLTLLAGILMIAVSGLGVPLWVIWGFTAIIVSVALALVSVQVAGTAPLCNCGITRLLAVAVEMNGWMDHRAVAVPESAHS